MLLLIILPLGVSLLLDIRRVQNFVVDRLAEAVSEHLQTTVSIDRVDIGLFSKIRVDGFMSRIMSAIRCSMWDTWMPTSRGSACWAEGLEFSRSTIADARPLPAPDPLGGR